MSDKMVSKRCTRRQQAIVRIASADKYENIATVDLHNSDLRKITLNNCPEQSSIQNANAQEEFFCDNQSKQKRGSIVESGINGRSCVGYTIIRRTSV